MHDLYVVCVCVINTLAAWGRVRVYSQNETNPGRFGQNAVIGTYKLKAFSF